MICKRLVLAALLFSGILLLPVGNENLFAQEADPAAVEAPLPAEKPPTVFIPFDKLSEVFGQEGATALVPYLDLQKLQELARKLKLDKTPEAVLLSAEYQITTEKDVARVQAKFQVQSFAENWSRVSIPLQGATIGKVTSEEARIVLQATGQGTYALLVPTKGVYSVELELFVKIASSPDGRSLSFKTPAAGITTADVIVPEPDQEITVEPTAVQRPVEPAGMQSRVKVNMGATNTISVSWAPRAGLKPQMELLTSVQNRILVTLADGLVHTQSNLEIDVLRGELQQVELLVPSDVRILDVSAPQARVRSWKAAPGDNGQIITVDLLQAVEKTLALEVHTEQPLPEGAFPLAGINEDDTVYGIHVRGAIRESGTLSIAHSTETQLTIDQQEGLIRIDGSTLPKDVQSSAKVHYKFYSTNFSLVAGIKPVEPRITVVNQTSISFQKGQLKLVSALHYNIERTGVFELKIKLPEELTIESVVTDRLREFTIDDATGVMTVSFLEQRTGNLQINLVGHIEHDEDETENLTLPIPEPLATFQETGTVTVVAPISLEIDTVEEETTGVFSQEVAAQQKGQNRVAAQWTFQSRPASIVVRTLRKPTRLTAKVGSTIRIDEDQAKIKTSARFLVEHAPVRLFRISVPEAISSKINIDVPNGGGQSIQNKVPAEEAVDGWIVWTIETQQDVLGQQIFDITYDLPLEREGEEQLSELTLQLPRLIGAVREADEEEEIPLTRIIGEIEIAKDRSLSVSSELDTERGEPIDVRELEIVSTGGDQAYRYFTQPAGVTIRSRKFEIQSVVETVISRALVEVAIGYDPTATFRCRYLMSSSERQRLLVKLPKNAEPLSVLVDGTLVDLEQADASEGSDDWDAYYVNVSRTKNSNDEFSLTLQFQWPINPPQFKGPLGRLQLAFPQFASTTGSAAVQQMRLALWVPDRFHLVGTPEKFNDSSDVDIGAAIFGFPSRPPVSNEELNSWIEDVPTGTIEFPAEGDVYSYQALGDIDSTRVSWWEMSYMVWVISGAIAVIGLLLKSTTWENRLGVVLLVVFAAAVYAVKDADTVAHGLAAARYGILLVVAIWIVQAIFGKRTDHPPVASPPQAVVVPPPEPDAASS